MKKNVILLLLLFIIFSMPAQDIDYSSVKVEYTRLPLKPLDRSVKNYQVIIIADYLQKIEQQKLNNQGRLTQAEIDHQLALKQYDEMVRQTAILHQANLNAWMRLTPQQQAVTQKPEMPFIPQPVKAVVEEFPYEKVFNTDLLSSQYIKLEGFNRLPENPLIIQVNLSGFENDAPKVTTQKRKVKGADGKTIEVPVYIYQFNCRHIFKLKILQPDGKYIMDEPFSLSMNFVPHASKDFMTQAELENYWQKAASGEIASAQEKIVIDNFKSLNEYLNSNFGYVKMMRHFSVIYVDEKTGYEDLKEAMTLAKNGYSLIGDKNTFAQGETFLRQAMEKWDAALKQSDVKNKKARIDEDVTEALIMNLAETSAWLNDFTKAQEYITLLGSFKISMKERSVIRNTENFMLDQKKRLENNNGM